MVSDPYDSDLVKAITGQLEDFESYGLVTSNQEKKVAG